MTYMYRSVGIGEGRSYKISFEVLHDIDNEELALFKNRTKIINLPVSEPRILLVYLIEKVCVSCDMSENQNAEIRRSRSLDMIPNFWPSVSLVSIPL